MKKLVYLLAVITLCCCQQKVTKQEQDTNYSTDTVFETEYTLVPPYDEENICSVFPVNKVGIVLERFRAFDKLCSTEIFGKIDSICAIGVKKSSENKTVFIEYWRINNSTELSEYKSKLEIVKNNEGIRYKPPTFWAWKTQGDNLVFFYSLEVPPSDLFFDYVFNNYQKIIEEENCCE